jgi:hypothetical protein
MRGDDHLAGEQRGNHRAQVGGREYQESFGVGTQAADGMRLDRSYASTGTSLKDLDAPEEPSRSMRGS